MAAGPLNVDCLASPVIAPVSAASVASSSTRPALGVRALTLYAFSSDNWARPAQEVQSIFWIIRAFLRLECERLRQQGVRLEVIGRRDRIPAPLLREIERTESATANGRSLHLRIAIDYSGRCPSLRYCGRGCRRHAIERHSPRNVFAHIITHALTADCGNVDLLIRTGGEQRLSDFLLWESATPNSSSPIACGPTSMSPISPPLSVTSATANAASAPSPQLRPIRQLSLTENAQ